MNYNLKNSGSQSFVASTNNLKPVYLMFMISCFLVFLCLDSSTQQVKLSWKQISVSGTLPPKRSFSSAIHDPLGNRMIVFGGWGTASGRCLNDLWELDLNTHAWKKLQPTGTPPSIRAGHVGVYDSKRHRMVVFGGSDWYRYHFNDSWALDLKSHTWYRIKATFPTSPVMHIRYSAFVAYDSIRDRIVIFGGGPGPYNDTWALYFSTKAWAYIPTTGTPTVRQGGSAVMDSRNDRMIIFGGAGYKWSPDYGEVFALNLSSSSWNTLGSFGGGVQTHTSVLFPGSGWMISMTGANLYSHGQAIMFDVTSGRWVNTTVTTPIPTLRWGASSVLDSTERRVLLFGGENNPRNGFNDLWELKWSSATISGSGPTAPGSVLKLNLNSPNDPGLSYQVGSSFGSGPIPLGSRTLGLSLDGLLIVSIQGSLPSIFQYYAGSLDPGGKATCSISIPMVSTLKGLRIYNCFVTIRTGAPFNIGSISNTFMFTIQ